MFYHTGLGENASFLYNSSQLTQLQKLFLGMYSYIHDVLEHIAITMSLACVNVVVRNFLRECSGSCLYRWMYGSISRKIPKSVSVHFVVPCVRVCFVFVK